MRVAFYTLGCKVNQYETDIMKKEFKDKGYDIVDFDKKADIYVVNSCSVTNMSTRKTRQYLSRAKKQGGIVVLVGCYAEEIKEDIKKNTCIYDKNGNEIVSISYGDTAFFDNVKSYYLALVLDDVINDIKEKENVSEDEAENILVTRGYKIYTCEDINIQNKLEEVYNNYDKFLNNAEAATVILDNNTGTIVAIVGGRNKDNRVITFGEPNYNDNVVTNKNRATERLSQPGGMLSILSVYACGLEKGVITLNSKYIDEPIKIGNYIPSNYYNGFKGEMTIEESIKSGTNVIKVKVMQDIGIGTSYEFLKDLGINSVNEKYDKNLHALSLGGLTMGCTLLELSSAYRTVLTDGEYKEPVSYSRVVDSKENIYLEKKGETRKVLKEDVCNSLKSCLKKNIDGKQVYIKSASSENHKCDWSTIITDKYTLSTWYGCDNIENIKSNDLEAKKLTLNLLDKIY